MLFGSQKQWPLLRGALYHNRSWLKEGSTGCLVLTGLAGGGGDANWDAASGEDKEV